MTYAPGAPAGVWRIPSRDLGPGAKLTLMSLWARADHDCQRTYEPCTVWARIEPGEGQAEALLKRTAEATGQSVRAVREHLTKLRKLGLVSTNGRVAILTPACQHCRKGVPVCRCGVDVYPSETDADSFANDAPTLPAAGSTSLQLNPPVPPSLPSPVDDARARDPEDPNGRAQERNHTHLQAPTRAGGEARRADSPAANRGGGTRAGGGEADANGPHHRRGGGSSLDDAPLNPSGPDECTGVAARWCFNCGLCTCRLVDESDWRRTLTDADCPLHGDKSTHGPDSGARSESHEHHRIRRTLAPATVGRGDGRASGPGRSETNAEEAASPRGARAHRGRGRHDHPGDGRGAVALELVRDRPKRDYELPPAVLDLVVEADWAYEAENPYWRQALLEVMRDKSLEAEDVATILRRYDQTQRSARPDRSRIWFVRGRGGRKAREFIDRALGRQQATPGVAFAMDGGLGS